MLPAISNTIQKIVVAYKKSFADTLCEGYRFAVKYAFRPADTRSVYYYKAEHSLLISHVKSNRVHLLDLATGKLRWFNHHGTTVRNVQVCNHQIISASWDGAVCITDFDSLELQLILTEKEMGRCPYMAISPGKDFAYSYSYDTDKNPDRTSNTIRKWSLADGKLKYLLKLPGKHLSSRRCGSCEVFENRLYVVSDSGHLHIFNSNNGNFLAETFFNDQLQSLCIIPSFNLLAMGGSEGNIYLCDLSGKRIQKKLKAHIYDVSHLLVHPDQPDILISVSFDGMLKIWKIPDLELLGSVFVSGISLWTVTVVNDLLIAGGEGGDIAIYDIKNLPDVNLKGKLVVSDDSYTFLPTESNTFYASDLSVMQVQRNEDRIMMDEPFADYLLNTANNFKVFKDLFSSENPDIFGFLNETKGFYQLTR